MSSDRICSAVGGANPPHVARQGQLKGESLAGSRVRKLQLARMERLSLCLNIELAQAAIDRVADHGIARELTVDTDLVCASGSEPTLDQRHRAEALQHMHLGGCLTAITRLADGHPMPVIRMPVNRGLNQGILKVGAPPDQRHVGALGGTALNLLLQVAVRDKLLNVKIVKLPFVRQGRILVQDAVH